MPEVAAQREIANARIRSGQALDHGKRPIARAVVHVNDLDIVLAVRRSVRGHGEAVVIPPQAWAGGLAATVIIGALAGLLPAIRAARLSPTQALWTI